jgi:aspartyl protease family protein
MSSVKRSWPSFLADSPPRGRRRKQQPASLMTRRLLWALVLGGAVSAAALIASNEQDAIANLLRHDVSALLLKVAIAVVLGGLALVLFRERISRALEALMFWAVVGLVLAVAYAYRVELAEAGDRVLAELLPGRAATLGRNVEIVRSSGGDFSVLVNINGAKVTMVLDTGATSVVLTPEAAKAAGLPLDMLNYSVNVDTANGRTRAAPVTLDRLAVGSLTERAVPALIAPAGQLKSSLLGMSFLNRLESWEVRGDKLRLRGMP